MKTFFLVVIANVTVWGLVSIFILKNEPRIEIINPNVSAVQLSTPEELIVNQEPVELVREEKREDSVDIDLDKMELTIWKDGVSETFPVLSKGDPERTNETPRGDFEALYMAEKHFSSIGHVWMPYSIQFKGNFFIHGWPYYPDGTDVPKGYSGGCVRLSTADAKRVYEFVKPGMPIHIR